MNGDHDDNVIVPNIQTTLDIPPERILNGAHKEGLEEVVLVGHTADGDLYFASSLGDSRKTLWLLARAQHSLLNMADGDSND